MPKGLSFIEQILNRTFASGSKTVRGEPVEPRFLPMNALRQAQGERMEPSTGSGRTDGAKVLLKNRSLIETEP